MNSGRSDSSSHISGSTCHSTYSGFRIEGDVGGIKNWGKG